MPNSNLLLVFVLLLVLFSILAFQTRTSDVRAPGTGPEHSAASAASRAPEKGCGWCCPHLQQNHIIVILVLLVVIVMHRKS